VDVVLVDVVLVDVVLVVEVLVVVLLVRSGPDQVRHCASTCTQHPASVAQYLER
jgi:hypothetical protein